MQTPKMRTAFQGQACHRPLRPPCIMRPACFGHARERRDPEAEPASSSGRAWPGHQPLRPSSGGRFDVEGETSHFRRAWISVGCGRGAQRRNRWHLFGQIRQRLPQLSARSTLRTLHSSTPVQFQTWAGGPKGVVRDWRGGRARWGARGRVVRCARERRRVKGSQNWAAGHHHDEILQRVATVATTASRRTGLLAAKSR
ncbi:hypothetical protein THAOC_00608 [Thalassiosira oceanica]|uniref:Uncharacterized protein n=1 Tax=Thalassiosira oceanica TaxID=159749 RepID=K0TK09_THAOC|nr:hypothetical protein THAOC_00608 [Thalassiosira oceanica]|eukprot:EJK77554.1 hypothetical protein THAOC_00608 [Thalassiosira oceanica]